MVNPIIKLPKGVYSKTPSVRVGMEKFGGKAEIRITSYVSVDEVTPAVTMAEESSHILLKIGMYNAAAAVKEQVIKAYENAQTIYHDSPTTTKLKGGGSALKDSGDLERALKGAKITMFDDGNVVKASITWDIPEAGTKGIMGAFRKNKNFEYLWAQETGANMSKIARPDAAVIEDANWVLTPRPFFLNAIQSSRTVAARAVASSYAPVIDTMLRSKRLPVRGFGLKLVENPFSTSTIGFLMYFVPPSILYAYVGAAGDIMGAWSGALLGEKQMFGWGRQYMWGRIGATKKTIRRKFRRKLWD